MEFSLKVYLSVMIKSWLLLAGLIVCMISFSQEQFMLTGTYTSGKSKGIYVHAFNSSTGSLRLVDSARVSNPSYLAVSSNGNYVYAVNETGKNSGGGKVTAFRFDRNTGHLTELNSQSSMGDNPCYVVIDKTGRWLIVGNYSSGTAAVLPVNEDGTLGKPGEVVQHKGSSANKRRQESAHIHATVLSADNKFLYVPDLGIDQLVVYAFDDKTGKLSVMDDMTIKQDPGSGPRHFDFHPSQQWAYLLNELSGMVTAFKNDNGRLLPIQNISALPEGYNQSFTSADIHVSPNGKFLYASNRDSSNTIAIFRIHKRTGKLKPAGHQSTLGRTPRNFSIDPSGKYLLVANQNSDNIVVFKINRKTGLLRETGHMADVGNPVCIKWIP